MSVLLCEILHEQNLDSNMPKGPWEFDEWTSIWSLFDRTCPLMYQLGTQEGKVRQLSFTVSGDTCKDIINLSSCWSVNTSNKCTVCFTFSTHIKACRIEILITLDLRTQSRQKNKLVKLDKEGIENINTTNATRRFWTQWHCQLWHYLIQSFCLNEKSAHFDCCQWL